MERKFIILLSMLKSVLLGFVWLLIFGAINSSTAQTMTFSKVFSNYGEAAENGLDIIEYNQGYIAVTYNSCLSNPSTDCVTLVRLNLEGDIAWYKEYEHYGTLKPQIAVIDDKIYLSGRTSEQDFQYLLYCLTMEGDIIWQKAFGDPQKNEWSPGLFVTSDEKLILYESRDRNNNHQYEWLPALLKVDTQGDSLAEYTFNEAQDATSVMKVIETHKKDLIVSYVYCPEACFLDLKAGVTCIDTMGNQKWTLDLPYSYIPKGCLVSEFGDFTFAVQWYINATEPNHDISPPAFFFTDQNGLILDTFIFKNQTLKEIYAINPTIPKGVVGCGSNYPDYLTASNPKKAGWCFLMDSSRQIVWDRTYADTSFRGDSYGLNKIIPTSDGGYIAIGTINNYMTGVPESHNWILKLNELGCLSPLCEDENYVSAINTPIFLKGKEIKLYPNPATDYTIVEFPVENLSKNLKIHIISNAGIRLKSIPVQTTQQRVDLYNLPAGVCYIVVEDGHEIYCSKKINIIKF